MKKILLVFMAFLLVGCVSTRPPFIENNIYKSERLPSVEVAVDSKIEYQGVITNTEIVSQVNYAERSTDIRRELHYFVNKDPLQAVFIVTRKLIRDRVYFKLLSKNQIKPCYSFKKTKIDGDTYVEFISTRAPFNNHEVAILYEKVPEFKNAKAMFKVFVKRAGAGNKIVTYIIYAESIPTNLASFKYMRDAHTKFLKDFEQRADANMRISKHVPE